MYRDVERERKGGMWVVDPPTLRPICGSLICSCPARTHLWVVDFEPRRMGFERWRGGFWGGGGGGGGYRGWSYESKRKCTKRDVDRKERMGWDGVDG